MLNHRHRSRRCLNCSLRSVSSPYRGDGAGPLRSRARSRGVVSRGSTCRAVTATWPNARDWRWPPSGSALAPRSRRSMFRRPRNSRRVRPISNEVSGGRFRFGIGVAHGTTHERLGITPGKPLADTRAFVEKLKSYDGTGALPPIILAALRKRMVALAAEIADGVLFANASLSHLPESLAVVPPAKRGDTDFLIGNMLPVCITHDEGAALALHRRRLVRYVLLPNYRKYWKEAGYGEEMSAIEHALAESRRDDIPRYLTDRWIADSTLYGRPRRCATGSPRGTLPGSTLRSSSP